MSPESLKLIRELAYIFAMVFSLALLPYAIKNKNVPARVSNILVSLSLAFISFLLFQVILLGNAYGSGSAPQLIARDLMTIPWVTLSIGLAGVVRFSIMNQNGRD